MSRFSGKISGMLARIKRAEQEVPQMEDPGKEFRSSSGLPIVPAFDGFRAFAIMGVVLLHLITIEQYAAGSSFDAALVWGFLGRAVEVLFVVSGFVVFLPTVARGGEFGPVGPYALRRAARLAPAYWLALAITIVLAFVLPHAATQTALLLIGVAVIAGSIGVVSAWLVTLFRFPGRNLLVWLLPLPLAVPTYITAYAYADLLDAIGPVQTALRGASSLNSVRRRIAWSRPVQ